MGDTNDPETVRHASNPRQSGALLSSGFGAVRREMTMIASARRPNVQQEFREFTQPTRAVSSILDNVTSSCSAAFGAFIHAHLGAFFEISPSKTWLPSCKMQTGGLLRLLSGACLRALPLH